MKEEIRKLFEDVWNVPNVLTMLRLVLVPVFIAVYVTGHSYAALVIFCIASFTDFLDGQIARHFHLITPFGKLMDPLADKLMVCTALTCLAANDVFPWLALVLVFLKEMTMVCGSAYMLGQGIVVYSNLLGKAAQCSFIVAMVMGFFHQDFVRSGMPYDQVFLWVSVVLCYFALVDYTMEGRRQLNEQTGT